MSQQKIGEVDANVSAGAPPGGTHAAREYAEAIELVRGLRATTEVPENRQARFWSLPASRISADFFCTAEHPQNGWFCMMADAAGHGLASAIFALHTPILFRESVLMGLSLAAIYARINRFLRRQHIAGYFVCGALVRVVGRDVEVINAGMPDGLLLAGDGHLTCAFTSSFLPFGVTHESEIASEGVVEPQRYRLARRDTASLLLYSDGLTDLGALDGAAVGRDGLLRMAMEGTQGLFERLIGRVMAAADRIHDDVSFAMIALPLREDTEDAAERRIATPPDDQLLAQVNNVAAALRIVENYDRGLVLTDAETRILYVNPAFSSFTGYSYEEALGQTPSMLSSGRHDADFYRAMWHDLQETGGWRGEIWNRRKDGSLYLEWLEIYAIQEDASDALQYLACFTPIKQQQGQEDRLRFLALHDSLTGLANRILLVDRGNQAIRRADRSERSLAVLFIDLDRFKTINDSLGHDIGDEVLVQVARRLDEALRDDDTLARFGGDEFVCLLPDIANRQDAGKVANKLLAALDKPVDVAGHQFKLGASIGVSAYPSDGRSLDDLIVAADRAMMRAKQAGGNLAKFFSAEMAVAVERQLEMEARLDAAIRTGQLELHYQPKFDLQLRRIVGAEALVRWRDPEHGMIPPGVFIPVAERSDLIAKIGNWVLREAASMVARRTAELPEDFHVAVNISPLQFERCDVAGEVRHVLDDLRIAPRHLQLEVTESMFIRDAESVGNMLKRVVELGVKVALDDFGTGYSNLGALIQLPLDTFKLDQQFVRGIDVDARHQSIARSMWYLADGLSKEVVAEGIESCEECKEISRLGYRFAQGYRFGKPMPEPELLEYLQRGLTECTDYCSAARVPD